MEWRKDPGLLKKTISWFSTFKKMVLVAGIASLRKQVLLSFLFPIFCYVLLQSSKFIERTTLKFEERKMCNGFGLDFGRQVTFDAIWLQSPCCLFLISWLIGICAWCFCYFNLLKREFETTLYMISGLPSFIVVLVLLPFLFMPNVLLSNFLTLAVFLSTCVVV